MKFVFSHWAPWFGTVVHGLSRLFNFVVALVSHAHV